MFGSKPSASKMEESLTLGIKELHLCYNLLDSDKGLTMYNDSIITIKNGVRSGKPTIRGLRITVYDILSMLASGMSYDEILADFPKLTREDILASLRYAARKESMTTLVPQSA